MGSRSAGRYGKRVMFEGKRAPHLLVLGPNGSGKGTRLLIPALLQMSGRSVVVIDPKGELAAVTAAWRRTVGDVVVLNPFGLHVGRYPDLASAGSIRWPRSMRRRRHSTTTPRASPKR